MNRKSFFLILLVVSAPLQAEIGIGKDLFQRGRVRASATAAYGSSFDEDYLVAGVGLGYFLTAGLEVGVDGEGWFGSDPEIYKVSPGIRYVLINRTNMMPYVGAFFRRTYIEGLEDLDSAGGRAGLYTRLGRNTFAGAGLVYEKYSDCNERLYSSCSSTYPEFTVSVGF